MKEDKDVFEPENQGDLTGSLDSLEKDYNIMDENTISDDEFDRMLEELMGGESLSSTGGDPVGGGEGAGILPLEEDSIPVPDPSFFGTDPNLLPQEEDPGNAPDGGMINIFGDPDDTSAGTGSIMDDDILNLINSINSTDTDGETDLGQGNTPENIGSIFADTLSVVNSLSDDEDIPDAAPDGEEVSGESKKSRKKKEKEQKKEERKAAKEEKRKKKGLLSKIFGNVKKERSEEEIAKIKEKIISDAQQKENAEEAKKQRAAAAKAEKQKKAAENKAAAAKKKQEDAKKKAEAAKLKKDAKARKKQELQNLVDAVDQDEGRINRIGATIIFVLFAILAGFILFKTKTHSYAASIANAEKHFGNKHYNEAYNYVVGLDIKEEDEEFYMQVMTIMYTYKQLNSYKNYYSAGLYPEALDSLLKGLRRYEQYTGIAMMLGVADDLDEVRAEIIADLKETYGLSEQEAVSVAAIKNQEDYTVKVYEIAGKVRR